MGEVRIQVQYCDPIAYLQALASAILGSPPMRDSGVFDGTQDGSRLFPLEAVEWFPYADHLASPQQFDDAVRVSS